VLLFNMLVGPVFSRAASPASASGKRSILLTTIISPFSDSVGKLIAGLAGVERADGVPRLAAAVGVADGLVRLQKSSCRRRI